MKAMGLLKNILTAGLITASLSTAAWAAEGIVTVDSLRLRGEPSTQGAILTSLSKNTTVEVLGITEDNWYYVNAQGQTGYLSGYYCQLSEGANVPTIGKAVSAIVTDGPLFVRLEPNTECQPIEILNVNTVVNLLSNVAVDGWYPTALGYVKEEYVSIITETEKMYHLADYNRPKYIDPDPVAQGQQVADYALSFTVFPYVIEGTTPAGFDCSGLVSYVYKAFGIDLPHGVRYLYQEGQEIARDEIRPGDLLFFGSLAHVAIYLGDNLIVHASTPESGIKVSSLSESFYQKNFYGAKRHLF